MPKMDCDLTQYLTKHGPPPLGVAYAVATAVASAMEAVHLHGVIHRDLKVQEQQDWKESAQGRCH